MNNVYFVNMFPDYVPPEDLAMALSQAAIVAADIDPENRRVSVVLHSQTYIPARLLDQAARDVCSLYGLKELELTAAHPETELQKIEEAELMQLFVSRNSMTRGVLAGAKWEWNGSDLTVKLLGNGKAALEELLPQVQTVLRERFAAPVTISIEAGQSLEGKALFDAMDSLRGEMMKGMPAAASRMEKKEDKAAQQAGDTFYGKPFRGNAFPFLSTIYFKIAPFE